MKSLSPYLIKFSGLKEGIHCFDYELGNKFFKNFDYHDFLDAQLLANLELEKQSTLLNLKFLFSGDIDVQCDVSMEHFNLDLKTNYSVVVQFKDNITSTADQVIFFSSGSHSIDVSPMIYESILLSVPQHQFHPGIEHGPLQSAIAHKLTDFTPTKHYN